MPRNVHLERHRTERIGWLRAAVLGANDGIVSTASLILGVVAASAGRSEMLVAGGAPVLKASMRVAFWGALAMGITAAVGKIFGAAA